MPIDLNMKILVADDDHTMLRIVEGFLNQLGFKNIFKASDGSAAFKLLRESQFSLVISDWNMSPMTGLQLIREMRTDNKLKTMPFIMMTTEGKQDNVITAKKMGVNNYILKPFNAETLKEKMMSVIGTF